MAEPVEPPKPKKPKPLHEQRSPNVKGIHHIGISVSDLQQSVAFYQQATTLLPISSQRVNPGATLVETASGLGQKSGKVTVLQGPNGYLELMQFSDQAAGEAIPVEGPGVTHICFQSPAPDEIYKKFRGLGASPVTWGDAPVDLGGYGVYYAYARDADQVMFEVEQIDRPLFKTPIWIAHVALVTHDIDRLLAFYESLLGVPPYQTNDAVRGSRASAVTGLDKVHSRAGWFNTGNMVLELWQYVNPVTQSPAEPRTFHEVGYNKFAFEVDDVHQQYQRLLAEGVKFLSEPVTNDEVTEVYGRDPDGNLFSLLQLAPGSDMSVENREQITW